MTLIICVYGILMSGSGQLPSDVEQQVTSEIKMDYTDPNLEDANKSNLLPLLKSLSPAEVMTMFGLTWTAKSSDVSDAVTAFIDKQVNITRTDVQALRAVGEGLEAIMKDVEEEAINKTPDQFFFFGVDTKFI